MEALSFVFGIFELVLGFSCLYSEYKRGSLSVFFWGTCLLMFHLPHFFSCIANSSDYPSWVYFKASVFVVAFDIIYLISRNILCRSYVFDDPLEIVLSSQEEDESTCSKKWLGYYCLCIGLTTIIMIVFIRGIAGNVLNSSWGGILNNRTDNNIVNLLFSFIPFFVDAAGGVILYFLLNHKYKSATLIGLVLVFASIIRREKQRFLVLVVPIFLFIYMKNRDLNARTIIRVLFFLIIGLYGILILAFMRDGKLADFIANFDLDVLTEYALNTVFTSSGEFALRRYFYQFLYSNNNYVGFNTGADYIRMLLFWLPTSLSFGLKPKDFAVTMAGALMGRPDQTIASAHPTIYGECYANFNFVGVFLGVYWAWFFSWVDKRILNDGQSNLKRVGICNVVGVCYIMIARGSAYNGFFTIVISLIILNVIDFCINKIRPKV